MEEFAAWFINALVRVSAEVVALGLQEVGGKPGRLVTVEGRGRLSSWPALYLNRNFTISTTATGAREHAATTTSSAAVSGTVRSTVCSNGQ